MQPDDKDAAVLPHRIDGSFALIHRPMPTPARTSGSRTRPICATGGAQAALPARRGAWWDANKVGLSPPLIETPRAG
jgi:beta-1,4-mannooligosaccharide/beta-1,4-mannosyl-N-acetylglucosamine phosphorylase